MLICSDKEHFKNLYANDTGFIPSGGCVDDVVNNQGNHQFTSVIMEHFMNASVCWINRSF